MNRDKKFDKLIWEHFGQEDNYAKLRHQLFRIKAIMSEAHPEFVRLSIDTQFCFCSTIGCIAIHTSTKDLRQLSMTKKKDEHFKYSINEGYVPPLSIEIQSKSKLLPEPK